MTRRVADCERIKKRINQFGKVFGNKETAVAYHTGNKELNIPATTVSLDELQKFPVLVITHEAYVRAMESGSCKSKLPYFLSWRQPNDPFTAMADPERYERKLRIVDECLDVVTSFMAGLDGLRETLGAIPQWIREKLPTEIESIEAVIKVLEDVHERARKCKPVKDLILRTGAPAEGTPPDFTGLIEALKAASLDGEHKHEGRLQSLAEIFQSWSYYHNKSGDHTMNTAKLMIPSNTRGCIVMDATAYVNRVYELHQDSEIKEPPHGSRTYRNFILHVSRGHNVGKGAMVANASTLMPQLMDSLKTRLKGKKVFGVCHKAVKPMMQGAAPKEFQLSCGHWNNIDGANDWKDCEAVIIAGLKYLPDTWTANTFMALRGVQSTAWLRSDGNRPWGKYPDIRRALKLGQMSSDIVQAINRIRCRKVSTDQGDCPPAEGYILLPSNQEEADTILNDIRAMMPGVVIKEDWQFNHQKKRTRKSNQETVLITYLKDMPGDVSQERKHIENVTQIPPRTMDWLIKKSRDPKTALHQTLKDIGVTVHTKRIGRSTKSFFLKAA